MIYIQNTYLQTIKMKKKVQNNKKNSVIRNCKWYFCLNEF